MEKLRDKYVRAATPAEKKAVAEEVQVYATKIVTHVWLGEWFSVSAVRSNIAIMPDNVWYHRATKEDLANIKRLYIDPLAG